MQGCAKLLKEDPDDLEAAVNVSDYAIDVGDPRAGLEAISKTSAATARIIDGRGGRYSTAELESNRCTLLFHARQLEEARKACNAAIEIDDSWGSRTLVKVLLA